MERIQFSGHSCWIENPDEIPINLEHIRIFFDQAGLVGDEQCYSVRFRIPNYADHSVECVIAAQTAKGSLRVAAAYGQGSMHVFHRALNAFAALSVTPHRGETYETNVA